MINLDIRCIERLKEKLSPLLDEVKVRSGNMIDFPGMVQLISFDEVLPKRGVEAEKINNYLGESAIFKFVFSELYELVYCSFEFDSEKETFDLIGSENFPTSEGLAGLLLDKFLCLPYEYCITLPLPLGTLDYLDDYYCIHPGLRFYRYGDLFFKKFPDKQKSGLLGKALLGLQSPSDWDDGAMLLQYQFEGYVSDFLDTDSSTFAFNKIKSFIGIMLASNIFCFSNNVAVPRQRTLDFHIRTGKTWRCVKSKTMEPDLASFLYGMRDAQWLSKLPDTPTKKGVFSASINEYSKCAMNMQSFGRVELASIWLLDSYKASDDLLSVVHAVVAMEILLGDKKSTDIVGINKLISNRCAYLIGESESKRTEIIKDFGEIYDLRSAIVHRGKNYISSDERALLAKLRWMVGRVIIKEVELISRDC